MGGDSWQRLAWNGCWWQARGGTCVSPLNVSRRPGSVPIGVSGERVYARGEVGSVAGVDVRRLAREERADFAAFLATLPPGHWEAPTLCAGWRVRDVVAHVISFDELDARGLAACVIQGRFWSPRVNAVAMARYREHSPEQLLTVLGEHVEPRGLQAALGGRVALIEGIIHHQDIRRALGMPRTIPLQRLLPALRTSLIAVDAGGFWRTRGVRLVATDVPFSFGVGPEVRGSAEALLMAIAYRRGVVSELTGPGQGKLARRIGG